MFTRRKWEVTNPKAKVIALYFVQEMLEGGN